MGLGDLLAMENGVGGGRSSSGLRMLLAQSESSTSVLVRTERELRQAVQTATDETVIVLGADITLGSENTTYGSPLRVERGRKFTLDLHDHTLKQHLLGATVHGCVIYVDQGAELTIKDDGGYYRGTITGGWTYGLGGGIKNFGTLTMFNGTITGNKALSADGPGSGSEYVIPASGGGVANYGTASFTNTVISDNKSDEGGGIYNAGGATLSFSGGTIRGNEATLGGGVYNERYESSCTLVSCRIESNRANAGGGLYDHAQLTSESSKCSVSASYVMKNTAYVGQNEKGYRGRGGGIYGCLANKLSQGAMPPIAIDASTIISNNVAEREGGGVYLGPSYEALMANVTVSGNETGVDGGGIYVDGSHVGNLQMKDYIFVKNNTLKMELSHSKIKTEQNNLHFDSHDNVIKVVGPFTGKTRIVVGFGSPYLLCKTLTQDYSEKGKASDQSEPPDPSKYFFGEGDFVTFLRNGEVRIATKVSYVDENDVAHEIIDYEEVTDSFTGSSDAAGWFVVPRDVTLEKRPVFGAASKLVVYDGVRLWCKKGIDVPRSGSLAVYGQRGQSGTIVADARNVEKAAGIGSSDSTPAGAVTINGANVEARGGLQGAGIGTGGNEHEPEQERAVSGPFILNRGAVKAWGGAQGAGIGHGAANYTQGSVLDTGRYDFEVIVRKGTLAAVGGEQGPGIGVTARSCFKLSVSGGEVSAWGGSGGAGIGASNVSSCFCYYSDLWFSGGTVWVQGGASMPGIGSGANDTNPNRPSNSMFFSGGVVECTKGAEASKPMDDKFNAYTAAESMVWAGGGQKDAQRVLAKDRQKALHDPAGTYVRVELCDHYESTPVAVEGEAGLYSLTCTWCGKSQQGWPVYYQPGEATGTMPYDFVRNVQGRQGRVTLPTTTTFKVPHGKELAGWKIGDQVYAPGATIDVNSALTAEAQWAMTWSSVQSYLNTAEAKDNPLVLDVDLIATAADKALTVPAGKQVELDLNGHTINRKLSKATPQGSALRVEGELTVRNGTITGGNNSTAGAEAGGGVSVAEGASFSMYNTTISGNRAADGAGVYTRGSVLLHTGSISGNTVEGSSAVGGGGGVMVDGGSLVVDSTGKITGNTAAGDGGGVLVQSGTFTLNGGRVQNNVAGDMGGGVFVSAYGSFELSGGPFVTDNTGNDTANNVYLQNPALSPLRDRGLNKQFNLGVTTAQQPASGAPVVVTEGLSGKDPVGHLTSDDPTYVVNLDSAGEAILGLPATVSFAPGTGGAGEMAPVVVASGSSYELPTNLFRASSGQSFVGWGLWDQVFSPGNTITVTRDLTLTALWAQNYPVWVGDTQVSEANKGDVLGDGTVSFDPATNTLALNGFEGLASSKNGTIIDVNDIDLTITGTGRIGLKRGYVTRGIEADKSLVLSGDLTIEGSTYAIDAKGSVTFAQGNVHVVADDTSGTGVYVWGAGSTISVATDVDLLEVSTRRRAFYTGGKLKVALGNGLYVKEPQSGSLSSAYVLIVHDAALEWNEPTYIWAEGYGSVTARRTRKSDPTVAETETVPTTSERTKQPTCTEHGETTYTAVFKNEAFESQTRTVANVPATGHVAAEKPVREHEVAPTCTEAGSYESVTYCTVCSEEIGRVRETLAPLGHVWDKGTITTAQTCEGTGVRTYTCTRDVTHTREEELPALGHDWPDEWELVTPATETTQGEEMRVCGRDASHVQRRIIPEKVHTHELSPVEAKDPTCVEGGNVAYWVCTGGEHPCRRIFTGEEGKQVEVSAEDVVIPARGHQWDEGVVTVEPLCVVDGVRTFSCRVCDATKDEVEESPREHLNAWGEEVIVEPSCTGSGYAWDVYRCTRCGESMTRRLVRHEKLGHQQPSQAVREHEVAATCTDPGAYELASYCERCGVELARTTEATESLGHDWGEPEYTWTTGDTNVIAQRVCTRDEAHVESEIAVVGTTIIREATKTEDGAKLLTATFTNPAFAKQEKTVVIPASSGQPEPGPDPTPQPDPDPEPSPKPQPDPDPDPDPTPGPEPTPTPDLDPTPDPDSTGFSYGMLEGADTTWTRESGPSVVMVVKRSEADETCFSHFVGVQMDGVTLSEDDYKARSGSTVITFSPAYLRGLTVGRHNVRILFDDGVVETTLMVAAASVDPVVPRGGGSQDKGNSDNPDVPQDGGSQDAGDSGDSVASHGDVPRGNGNDGQAATDAGGAGAQDARGGQSGDKTSAAAPQTGDPFSLPLVATLAACGLLILLVGAARKNQ